MSFTSISSLFTSSGVITIDTDALLETTQPMSLKTVTFNIRSVKSILVELIDLGKIKTY